MKTNKQRREERTEGKEKYIHKRIMKERKKEMMK
jgi:hypothetical protein